MPRFVDKEELSIELKSSPQRNSSNLSIELPDKDLWEINSSDIKFGNQIGSGSSGVVFKGVWRKIPG